ncbi:MAG: FtsX-like permease family protein, partial [Rhodanobacter sp.]
MTLDIKPVISALRRHKAGTLLIVLQIALTLAIVCNALFMIQQRASKMSQPLGVDGRDVFVVHNEWVGQPPDIDAQMHADVAALRQLPQVVDAFATDSEPLGGNGWDSGVLLAPDQRSETAHAAQFFDDDHALGVFGMQLVAGRNFRADEIASIDSQSPTEPPVTIITQALAQHLFPDGHVLGRSIYFGAGTKPSMVIGIVKHLHTPYTIAASDGFSDQSAIMPLRLLTNRTDYVARARPGQLADAMKAAHRQLFALNGARVIDPVTGIVSFDTLRIAAYERDRGMLTLMGAICVVLLAVTAAGIVGLTSFWVGQRRKQIGVRRALGARRRDILSYFLTENFLISVAGVALGAVLALALNLWMVAHYAQNHLPWAFIGLGALILLLLGQAAVMAP